MSRRALRRHKRQQDAELNITAFMNLMVVLVPFLLLNAVFSQVSILKMNLPNISDEPPKEDPKKPPLVLEIIVGAEGLIVNDRESGPLTRIPLQRELHDFKKLNEFLVSIKSRFPEITSATILSQEDTSYETIIQLMDAARYSESIDADGTSTFYELFPGISIGSAPQ
ncbi:MAG: biopolymer transporter ExbD [Pseudomonadota bacterium]